MTMEIPVIDQQQQQQRTSTKAPPPSAFSHPLPPPPPPPPIRSLDQQQQGQPSQQSHQFNYASRRPQHQMQQQQPPPERPLPNPPPLTAEFASRQSQSQHHQHATVAEVGMSGTMIDRLGEGSRRSDAAYSHSSDASTTTSKLPTNTLADSATATTSSTTAIASGSLPSYSQYSSPYYYPQQLQSTSSPAINAASTTTSTLLSREGGLETLKARNIHHATTASSSSSSGTSSGVPTTSSSVIISSGGSPRNSPSANYNINSSNSSNINLSIAILLFPPLLLLFLQDMSSSFPLMVLVCCGLLVYSFDLANLGSSSISSGGAGVKQQSSGGGGGMYTLIAIWSSWILLSFVVGYDVIFLGDGELGTGRRYIIGDVATDNGNEQLLSTDFEQRGVMQVPSSSYQNNNSGIDIYGFTLLLARLGTSILLLFQLATWTTLQFHWLHTTMPVMITFLERILYSTLPLVSAAMMAASCYGLVSSSSIGLDSLATVVPYVFAFHLTLGIWLVGSASSFLVADGDEQRGSSPTRRQGLDSDISSKYDKSATTKSVLSHVCAIHPREGRTLSYLLVFLPPLIHISTFRLRMAGYSSYASWDDLFDFILVSTVPYILHYSLLLASSSGAAPVIDERWRRSLPWLLKTGTSPAEGRTIRGASVPMTISLLGCMAFQHRFLVPLCARASYIINGHGGVISLMAATTFLTLGTIFAYSSVWFLGRKNSKDEYLLGEYHEDFFQLLVAVSATCYGLSCGPKWTFLPVPMLLAESLALWVLTKQLRYAVLTAFVYFTVASIVVAYRLTFLNESIEILPGKAIIMKKFANLAMCASIWLILLVGLFVRAPGGYGSQLMRKFDFRGICLTIYCAVLVVMEFALLPEPMPLYSRDNFEVGRVAVYSSRIAYFTGFLSLVIILHVKAQHLISVGSTVISSSIVVGKVFAVVIESSIGDSLGMLYRRWAAASLLLISICAPSLLKPTQVKMPRFHRKRQDVKGKPSSMLILPRNAPSALVIYCAILLPSVIVASVHLVLGPLVGILTGLNSGASPKLSEMIGYSVSLWGASVLSALNHILPDGAAEVWRRVAALTFIVGMFVSFAAPAFPGTSSSSTSLDINDAFQYVPNLDVEDDATSGGWGLVSAFLAILMAILGPLELREVRDSSGKRDTRQLLRLMIFGMMFGCGLSWFITMQSMSKDIFIPIFVTTFSCMIMASLGTVAAVMGYFLDAREFAEAEQIANIWVGVFPVFFVISSISLSAHAHPFGIGGWASTYLSVCGLLAGAFCVTVRMRDEKTSITRGYGNMSCVMSWLCAIIVVYGRYGVAGVGVVGTTSVAGIPASVLGTILCAPILLLLEGEGSSGGGRKKYQVSSTKAKSKGLVLPTLTRSNWFAPLLAGTVSVFLVATCYAIFLRGCGLSKFSLLFGGSDLTKSKDDVLSHVHGSASKITGIRELDDVATMAKKSVVHTRTMVASIKLGDSGIWTARNIWGPLMHMMGLIAVLPSMQYLVRHSCVGAAPSARIVLLTLPPNVLAMAIGRGIPSLIALAAISCVGGMIQYTIVEKGGRVG